MRTGERREQKKRKASCHEARREEKREASVSPRSPSLSDSYTSSSPLREKIGRANPTPESGDRQTAIASLSRSALEKMEGEARALRWEISEEQKRASTHAEQAKKLLSNHERAIRNIINTVHPGP